MTEERSVAALASADAAEEVASAAMTAAGGAVHDEMEAAAVVKETQAALSKALRQVKGIMPAEDEAERKRLAQQCVLRPTCCHTRVSRCLCHAALVRTSLSPLPSSARVVLRQCLLGL